jgi:hypothetical protein
VRPSGSCQLAEPPWCVPAKASPRPGSPWTDARGPKCELCESLLTPHAPRSYRVHSATLRVTATRPQPPQHTPHSDPNLRCELGGSLCRGHRRAVATAWTAPHCVRQAATRRQPSGGVPLPPNPEASQPGGRCGAKYDARRSDTSVGCALTVTTKNGLCDAWAPSAMAGPFSGRGRGRRTCGSARCCR